MTVRTALIVGAGIGGLAAGVALQRAGWRVRIFERSRNPRELGFALMLAPNALAALRELGLAEAVMEHAATPVRVEIRQPGGRVLRRLESRTGSCSVWPARDGRAPAGVARRTARRRRG